MLLVKNTLLFLVTLYLLSISHSFAETDASKIGYSLLGICNPSWPCNATIDLLRKDERLVLSVLTGNSFNNKDCPCLKRILDDPRDKFIRFHIINGTCFSARGRTCHEDETFYNTEMQDVRIANEDTVNQVLARTEDEMLRTRELIDQAKKSKGKLECFVSPCLECQLGDPIRKRLLSLAEQKFPECKIVDNPVNFDCLDGYICERHGSLELYSAPCIADLDGVDLYAINTEEYLKKSSVCYASFLWTPSFNCLDAISTNQFIFPDRRNCQELKSQIREGIKATIKLRKPY